MPVAGIIFLELLSIFERGKEVMKKRIAVLLLGCSLAFGMSAGAQVYSDTATVQAVQEKLNEAGFECGTADGIAGLKTAQAISDYQAANGLEQTGEIDDELLAAMGLGDADEEAEDSAETEAAADAQGEEAAETADAADASESSAQVLNANQIVVSAGVGEDGTSIVYEAQNGSENGAFVNIKDVIVNDVALQSGNSADYYTWDMAYFYGEVGPYLEDQAAYEQMTSIYYLAPGETRSITYDVDADTLALFGYTQVENIKTSVNGYALNTTLAFDGSDTLEEDAITDAVTGETTEIVVDGSWDSTWNEVEGTVVYEDESIRVISTGVTDGDYDVLQFGLIVENSSAATVNISTDYDSAGMVNDETVSDDYIYLTVPSESRAIGYLTIEANVTADEVVSAYRGLYYYDDDTYEDHKFDFTYGDVDTEAAGADAVAKKAQANAESAESEKAEAVANSDITIEEQVLCDQDDVIITANAIGKGEYDSNYTLYITVTNNREEDIQLSLSDFRKSGSYWGSGTYLFLNDGFNVAGYVELDDGTNAIAAGATTTASISLGSWMTLSSYGIDNVGQIEIAFTGSSTDYDELFRTEPAVIETSAYAEMDTELDEEMAQLYSEDGLEVYAQYVPADYEGGTGSIRLAVKGSFGDATGVGISELTVNGIAYDDGYDGLVAGTWIGGDSWFVTELYLSESYFDGDITDVQSMSLRVITYDVDDYEYNPVLDTGDLDVSVG